MKKNMGTIDKTLRIIFGIIFGILYFSETVTGTIGIIILIITVMFILTSLVSFCPLYVPFKISTLKEKKPQ
jgi:hypothetical protein